MKNILFAFLLLFIFGACNNKTDIRPVTIDTLNLTPPAALDTLQVQPRPSDSLLRTKRY